ncbi:MAG: type III pantothenate kinase [Thermodesulfobacteriota bacterium]
MLLVIDIGNTTTVIGVYDGKRLLHHWRIGTEAGKTADEYGVTLMELLHLSDADAGDIEGAIISSVVPTLTDTFHEMVERYFGTTPLSVGPGIKTGMPIMTDNPREVGADRIVNGVAAFDRYREAVIVVDSGTAITFDYISSRGEYMGGAIAPGMDLSLDALFHRTAKLPRVEIVKPKRVVGKCTVESMQAGLFFGFRGLIDEVVRRFKVEVGGSPRVIATGGGASLLADKCETIDEYDAFLTLEGLMIIYGKNRP